MLYHLCAVCIPPLAWIGVNNRSCEMETRVATHIQLFILLDGVVYTICRVESGFLASG